MHLAAELQSHHTQEFFSRREEERRLELREIPRGFGEPSSVEGGEESDAKGERGPAIANPAMKENVCQIQSY